MAGRAIKVQLLPMQIRTPGWLKKFRSVSAKWIFWHYKIGTHQWWAGPRCFLAVRQNPLHEMSPTQNNKCAHYQAGKKNAGFGAQKWPVGIWRQCASRGCNAPNAPTANPSVPNRVPNRPSDTWATLIFWDQFTKIPFWCAK